MSGHEGIVLDAETAALAPEGARMTLRYGTERVAIREGDVLMPGVDILTHIGGRPVAELVAEADQAEADAEALRAEASALEVCGHRRAPYAMRAIADRIDERRAKSIGARLVAAAHAQWADTEGVPS